MFIIFFNWTMNAHANKPKMNKLTPLKPSSNITAAVATANNPVMNEDIPNAIFFIVSMCLFYRI